MDYVTLGKGGPKASAVGLGMWQAGGSGWGADVTDDSAVAAMRRATELGVNLFDTAEGYGQGHSEEVVGRAVREIGRDRVMVATKVSGFHTRPDDVRKSCEASLRRLGLPEIDLLQIHWPDPFEQVPLRHTMKALEALCAAGKVRHLGVSNFAPRDLEEARAALSRADIVSNQIHWSLLHRWVEEDTAPYCAREGIAILAWSPIEKGLLAGTIGPGYAPTDDVRKREKLFKEPNLAEVARLVPVLREVAASHGRTPSQVALNWLMRQAGTVVPIPGAKRAAQAEENAGAAGWRLTDAEVRRLSDVSASLRLDTF